MSPRLAGVASLALALTLALSSAPAAAAAADTAASAEPNAHAPSPERSVDLGLRLGYAAPVGAYDAGTHASDLSRGGLPLALDATARVTHARWSLFVGGALAYAITIPRLCESAPDCISSLGRDLELLALARLRGPRVGLLLPEAELGTGWSWSSRSLASRDATSTRTFDGPLLLRAAVTPSLALGSRLRLGVVVGGSIAATARATLDAPGVHDETHRGAGLHGSLDLGLRAAMDF